ncbi:MAG: lytic transglycosylase domain-containing protein [Bryobacterales bacterium]|nr:lytic transglycosylase domain-containing protein [Bryobacterales bacterium]
MRFCCQILSLAAMGGGLLAGAEVASPVVEPVRKLATVRVDPGSGRLVRRTTVIAPKVIQPVVVAGSGADGNAPLQLAPDAGVNEIIDKVAQQYSMDPLLVHSVIQVESSYNKYAVSPKGAQGMMQLIPSTARTLGVKNPFDARENIEAGVRYLKQLQAAFQDDRLALAAYNSGPAAVAKYGSIPPYAETQNYVYQVGKRWGAARRAAETKPAGSKVERPKMIEQFVDSEGRLHLRMR